jgi:hypothetical protein
MFVLVCDVLFCHMLRCVLLVLAWVYRRCLGVLGRCARDVSGDTA